MSSEDVQAPSFCVFHQQTSAHAAIAHEYADRAGNLLQALSSSHLTVHPGMLAVPCLTLDMMQGYLCESHICTALNRSAIHGYRPQPMQKTKLLLDMIWVPAGNLSLASLGHHSHNGSSDGKTCQAAYGWDCARRITSPCPDQSSLSCQHTAPKTWHSCCRASNLRMLGHT